MFKSNICNTLSLHIIPPEIRAVKQGCGSNDKIENEKQIKEEKHRQMKNFHDYNFAD